MGNIEVTSNGYWRNSGEIISATWNSKENYVTIGDVRVIEGVLYRAGTIYRRFILKDIVVWNRVLPSMIRFNFNNNLDLGYLFWLYHQLDIDKLEEDYKKEND